MENNQSQHPGEVVAPWLNRTLSKPELIQYLHLLVESIDAGEAIAYLEGKFTSELLEQAKVTAIGCVRIRDDMNERMRAIRSGRQAD